MRALLFLSLVAGVLFSCTKYTERKVEGVWKLEEVRVCYMDSCWDSLEDRGTSNTYNKIELRLERDRTAEGRFYNNGVLLYHVPFSYIFDNKTGRISFVGPYDVQHPGFFGSNVELDELNTNNMVYRMIEDFPEEETTYRYTRLQ